MDRKNEKFKVWVSSELDKRSWSIRELGRRCDFTFGHISNVMRGVKPVTWDLVASIALTFGQRPEEGFRAAGLLPSQNGKTTDLNEIAQHLSEQQLDDLIQYAEWRRKQDG